MRGGRKGKEKERERKADFFYRQRGIQSEFYVKEGED